MTNIKYASRSKLKYRIEGKKYEFQSVWTQNAKNGWDCQYLCFCEIIVLAIQYVFQQIMKRYTLIIQAIPNFNEFTAIFNLLILVAKNIG